MILVAISYGSDTAGTTTTTTGSSTRRHQQHHHHHNFGRGLRLYHGCSATPLSGGGPHRPPACGAEPPEPPLRAALRSMATTTPTKRTASKPEAAQILERSSISRASEAHFPFQTTEERLELRPDSKCVKLTIHSVTHNQ